MLDLGKIKGVVEQWPNETVVLGPNHEFNQYNTLNKIDLYYASRFVKGQTEGKFRKIFFNIIKNRVNSATKAVDFDTKDIRVIAEKGQSFYPAWFLEKELRQFMKEEHFGELLNEMVTKLPRYGSIVIKNVDGKPKFIPLKNLVLDPTIDFIKNSPYVAEEHLYTFDEFEEIANKRGWENADEVLKLYALAEEPMIRVVEYYGYFNQGDLDDSDSKKFVRGMAIVSGLEFYQKDGVKERPGYGVFTLKKMEVKEWPYKDVHWDKEEGRWLGVGVAEDLFSNQEYTNEIANLERRALQWSSKKLWQTKDSTAPNNLFTEVDNGSVFQVNSEITPISMEERNLPQYQSLFDRIEENSNQRAFSFEVNTGESLPSGTPFRLGALLSNAVNSHFAFKREGLGMFVQELLFEFVIPNFKKQKNKSHLLNLEAESDELERFDEMISGSFLQDAVDEFEKTHGKLPSLLEFEVEKQRIMGKLRDKPTRFLEIPEGFYEEIKYKIDIIITGEQVDLPSQIETLTNLYSTPTVQQNPTLATKILEKILNLAGESPVGLPLNTPQIAAPAQAGFKNSPSAKPPSIKPMGV